MIVLVPLHTVGWRIGFDLAGHQKVFALFHRPVLSLNLDTCEIGDVEISARLLGRGQPESRHLGRASYRLPVL